MFLFQQTMIDHHNESASTFLFFVHILDSDVSEKYISLITLYFFPHLQSRFRVV